MVLTIGFPAFREEAVADDCADLSHLFSLSQQNFSSINAGATQYKNEFSSTLLLEGAKHCVIRFEEDDASFICHWYYDDYDRSTTAYNGTAEIVQRCIGKAAILRTNPSRTDGSQSVTFKVGDDIRVSVRESGAIERQFGRRSVALTVSR
ncbi:MAG: hypothetical protein ACXW6K_20615 [Candidatus Binatia bacterium]